MYKIIRTDKKLPKSLSGVFKSYENARSTLRKWLRKYSLNKSYDQGWIWHNNPSHTDYGFSIKKA